MTHPKKVWIDLFPEPTSLQIVAQLSWEVYSKSVCVDYSGTELENLTLLKTESVHKVVV